MRDVVIRDVFLLAIALHRENDNFPRGDDMLRRLPGSILLFTTFALALFQRTPASAQIEPLRLDTGGYRSMVLYENGVAVGELMRVDTDPGKHSEHYVLWPRYIYPNPTNGVGRARSGS